MSKIEHREWHPLIGLPRILYLEAIHDDYEGLRFLLRGDDQFGKCLRIQFDSVVAYLNSNESFRAATWNATRDSRPSTTLLTVTGSPFSEMVLKASGGVVLHKEITQYAIYTPEDCVDVIALAPPVVEWL